MPHLYSRDAVLSNSTTSTNTTSSNTTLLDLTQYVQSDLTNIGYAGPDVAAVPYHLDDDYINGYGFTSLILADSNGSYSVAACSDDNLYIHSQLSVADSGDFTQCNSLWQRYEDVVLATPNGGMLHYYNNTMAKVGVSRLRTADQSYIPNTSVYV